MTFPMTFSIYIYIHYLSIMYPWYIRCVSMIYLWYIHDMCRFPKIGLPLVIIHFFMAFSLSKTIQLFGYLHDELDASIYLTWAHHSRSPYRLRLLSRLGPGHWWSREFAATTHQWHLLSLILRQDRLDASTENHWNWPFFVDWPNKNGDFPRWCWSTGILS